MKIGSILFCMFAIQSSNLDITFHNNAWSLGFIILCISIMGESVKEFKQWEKNEKSNS